MSQPIAPFDLFNLPPVPRGEPVWPLARLYPNQGEWNEDRYFDLDATILVELSNGCLEFPAVPTIPHQLIVFYLAKLLDAYVTARGLGLVLLAPLPVQLWPDKIREPDILFIRPDRRRGKYAAGADLVMEVVSEGADDRQRDLVTKRDEYAAAGIPEYWIIDPVERRITVLTLEGQFYRVHGVFQEGAAATSALLPGFCVDVTSVLAAGSAGE